MLIMSPCQATEPLGEDWQHPKLQQHHPISQEGGSLIHTGRPQGLGFPPTPLRICCVTQATGLFTSESQFALLGHEISFCSLCLKAADKFCT